MKVKVCKDHSLNHDNYLYTEGATLEIEDDQAQELIDAGVVKEATEKTKQAEASHEVEVKGVVKKDAN